MAVTLQWSDASRDHIARHGIREEDVEAILLGRSRYLRKAGTRSIVIGKTGGRYLFIVVDKSMFGENALEVVTARVATPAEKHLFQRRGKGRQ